MMDGGYSVAQLIAQEVPQLKHVTTEYRQRGEPDTTSQYTTESRKLQDGDVEVTAANGYRIVKDDESVLFLEHRPGKPVLQS